MDPASLGLIAASCLCGARLDAPRAADTGAPSIRFSAILPSAATEAAQPDQPGEAAPPADTPPEAAASPRFGQQGSRWWTFGGGASTDFSEDTHYNGHVAFSYFLVDHFEAGVELATWYFDQEHYDELGINPVLIFRWHLLHNEKWTFYVDAGIGVVFSTDSVPEGGTHFNFTPRVGVGFTRALGDRGARLQAGLRWDHVSNARITGDRGNPAYDGPLIYAGIIIPF